VAAPNTLDLTVPLHNTPQMPVCCTGSPHRPSTRVGAIPRRARLVTAELRMCAPFEAHYPLFLDQCVNPLPIVERLQARPPPSAKRLRAHVCSWRFRPSRNARPRNHRIRVPQSDRSKHCQPQNRGDLVIVAHRNTRALLHDSGRKCGVLTFSALTWIRQRPLRRLRQPRRARRGGSH